MGGADVGRSGKSEELWGCEVGEKREEGRGKTQKKRGSQKKKEGGVEMVEEKNDVVGVGWVG